MPVSIFPVDSRRRRKSLLLPLKTDSDGSGSNRSMASPVATIPSSPASSSSVNVEGDHKLFSLSNLTHRTKRSHSSRDSSVFEYSVTGPAPGNIQHQNSTSSNGSANHNPRPSSFSHRRKLSKSRPVSAPFEVMNRRSSGFSDDYSRMSVADTLSTCTTTPASIEWKTQDVEGFSALETDTKLLTTKTPYLVVTTDYLVKVKNRADVFALFPQLQSDGQRPASMGPPPEPILVIPTTSIVSVFVAESTKPSFGLEVWWKAQAGVSFLHTTFYFDLPTDRDEQLYNIVQTIRGPHIEEKDFARRSVEVSELIRTIQETEEPKFINHNLQIFPVVPRGITRKESGFKQEDDPKRPQESPAFYLVIGPHLCYFIELQRGKNGDLVCKHKTFGLVTLELFKADWTIHQERFNITFRDPFQAPVTLELASRYYRHIIRDFCAVDRYLKPAWPQIWQSREIFHVTGLKETHLVTAGEDFGSVKRTLDAYLAAYRCPAVDWEINWKTKFAPEFRLLPAKDGNNYSPLQLLAVLRALRYNDYFNSLSFRDIDLGVLWSVSDHHARRGNVAWLSRTLVALGTDEIEVLKISPVLHQEFHALAFCSENIRQIDFTNASKSYPNKVSTSGQDTPTIQFLTPILELLKAGITRCNRLILAGNLLLQPDLAELAEALKAAPIQALDVSYCGLDDMSLRDLIITPLLDGPRMVQVLDLSGNPGRVACQTVPDLLYSLGDLRELNLAGSLRGEMTGPLLPIEALENLPGLELLDISNYALNIPTLREIEEWLALRGSKIDNQVPVRFRKLVLNRCAITGAKAAKLFNAIGVNHGLYLCLNGNPVEDGIDALCDAIRQSQTPAGLSMEMIEFREESHYLSLIRALTETRYITSLSLLGTAPSTPSQGTCSREAIRVFERFFAENKSIRYLDISGFSGKLDDGQLAKGFGRSLIGLTRNKYLTYLRIRNQNLHEDAGILGKVISENRQLMLFDCQDNKFNCTSFQFLVQSMRTNTQIIEFPVERRERDAIWKNTLQGLNRGPYGQILTSTTGTGTVPTKGKKGKKHESHKSLSLGKMTQHPAANGSSSNLKDPLKEQETMLRTVLSRLFDELDGYLRRNRHALEEASGQMLDFDGLASDGQEEVWPGSPAAVDVENPIDDTGRNAVDMSPTEQGSGGQGGLAPDTAAMLKARRATVRSSMIASGKYNIGAYPSPPTLPPPPIPSFSLFPDISETTLDPVTEVDTPMLEFQRELELAADAAINGSDGGTPIFANEIRRNSGIYANSTGNGSSGYLSQHSASSSRSEGISPMTMPATPNPPTTAPPPIPRVPVSSRHSSFTPSLPAVSSRNSSFQPPALPTMVPPPPPRPTSTSALASASAPAVLESTTGSKRSGTIIGGEDDDSELMKLIRDFGATGFA
ncbi:unnamed protein product [Sordaria macrospora k-hell]|uniref:WGS project CABT00000000 data, contig 2.25 n=2 Tax=Sordaria macrospora TaxID=5147 RepID=F7W3M7_SORMK|nr:uncharacterized protein SMAC_05355 [Sordaria macrospora k-hell]CCC12283.1 unnamed protein product [Sordaria macrospora k-hell]